MTDERSEWCIVLRPVEPALLDFSRVEQAKMDAEAKGDLANAMGEEMWLKEWRAKRATTEL